MQARRWGLVEGSRMPVACHRARRGVGESGRDGSIPGSRQRVQVLRFRSGRSGTPRRGCGCIARSSRCAAAGMGDPLMPAFADGVGEPGRSVARSVVRHDALDLRQAVGSEPRSRPVEEGNGGHGLLVLQSFGVAESGVAESGVAVDRGVQEDVAGLRAPTGRVRHRSTSRRRPSTVNGQRRVAMCDPRACTGHHTTTSRTCGNDVTPSLAKKWPAPGTTRGEASRRRARRSVCPVGT